MWHFYSHNWAEAGAMSLWPLPDRPARQATGPCWYSAAWQESDRRRVRRRALCSRSANFCLSGSSVPVSQGRCFQERTVFRSGSKLSAHRAAWNSRLRRACWGLPARAAQGPSRQAAETGRRILTTSLRFGADASLDELIPRLSPNGLRGGFANGAARSALH